MPSRIRSRSGFAMPMTILVLLVLAVGLTGSLSFVTSERRVLDNISLQQNAFQTAQAGLDEYFSNRRGLGLGGVPGATETITLNVGDGTADVVLERLRPEIGPNPALYIVRSTGVIPGPRPQDPDSRRTVAQLAVWQTATLEVTSGWTALTGLQKNGNAGTISGIDACGVAPPLPGIAAPDPPGVDTNGAWVPVGNPPVEDLGTPAEMDTELPFDWEGIVNKTSIYPDVEIPGDPWPSFADPDYWPIVHATGDFALNTSGRGVLVVTGSLEMNGSARWNGVVLVGDHLVSNGNNRVQGATYSGLNVILADDPEDWIQKMGQNSVGNGNKQFQYNSCSVQSAMDSGFGGLRVFDNVWMDNWPVQ